MRYILFVFIGNILFNMKVCNGNLGFEEDNLLLGINIRGNVRCIVFKKNIMEWEREDWGKDSYIDFIGRMKSSLL